MAVRGGVGARIEEGRGMGGNEVLVGGVEDKRG